MPISSTSNYAVVALGLTADIPNGGTLTAPYPTGTTQASFTGANAGLASDNMAIIGQAKYTGAQVGFSYGASNVTVTNNSGVTWPAAVTGQIEPAIARFGYPRADPVQVYNGPKAIV